MSPCKVQLQVEVERRVLTSSLDASHVGRPPSMMDMSKRLADLCRKTTSLHLHLLRFVICNSASEKMSSFRLKNVGFCEWYKHNVLLAMFNTRYLFRSCTHVLQPSKVHITLESVCMVWDTVDVTFERSRCCSHVGSREDEVAVLLDPSSHGQGS